MNIVLLLMFFFIITGCAILFYKLTRLTTEESIVTAVAGSITLLFLSGIIRNLIIGTYIIYFSSALGWLLLFFGSHLPGLVHRHKPSLKFFSPGYCMLFLFFCYGIIALRGATFYIWDEYGTWGRVVKHMYTTNTLPLAPVYLGGSEKNPIGTSLFHYLMARIAGYSEGHLYISNFLLISAGLMLPMFRVTWKKWYKVCIYGVFIFSCLFIFGRYPYMSLLVDNSTAAWAGGIAAWVYLSRNKKDTLILPFLALFALALFKKNIGLMLSYMIIFFWFILYLISSRQTIPQRIKYTFSTFLKEKRWVYLLLILIPLSGLFLHNINLQTGSTIYLGKEPISEILNTAAYSDRISLTLNSIFQKFFHDPVSTKLTTLHILVLWVMMSVLTNLTIENRIERKRFTGMNVLLILGLFVYLFAMIYAYVNIFSADIGTIAEEYIRYMSIYVLMGTVLLFSSIIYLKKDRKNKLINYGIWAIVIGLALCPIVSNSFYDQVALSGLHKNKVYQRAMGIRVTAEKIMEDTEKEDQIYLVAQDRNGFELVVARYMMDGRVRLGEGNRYTQNITAPGTADDPRMQLEMTMEDFAERIMEGGYAYLWVYETNDYFNTFRGLFADRDIQENALYEIKQDGNHIKFHLKEKY